MAKIEKSIVINASPEVVWPLLRWGMTPEWYEPFKKVEYTSEERDEVGETVHITGEIAGQKAEWDGETTGQVLNESHAWRSIGGSFTGFGSHTLTSTETGTKVTLAMDYELPYSVLGKLIDRLKVHKAMEKSFEVGLKNLKYIIEK